MKTLTYVLAAHRFLGHRIIDGDEETGEGHEAIPLCVCGWEGDDWAAHVAAAYRATRTITTRQQLDALPDRTVIQELDNSETLLKKYDADWWMDLADDPGVQVGFVAAHCLPALVLWLPEEA